MSSVSTTSVRRWRRRVYGRWERGKPKRADEGQRLSAEGRERRSGVAAIWCRGTRPGAGALDTRRSTLCVGRCGVAAAAEEEEEEEEEGVDEVEEETAGRCIRA
jgi:hypothetical protein